MRVDDGRVGVAAAGFCRPDVGTRDIPSGGNEKAVWVDGAVPRLWPTGRRDDAVRAALSRRP